jgi:hypothetical protein
MDKKKQSERYFVDHVQRYYPGFLPPGSPSDWESPDFMIDDQGMTVGVEVTQFFKTGNGPLPEIQIVQFQRKVVARAREIYAAQHPLRPIHFNAYFNNEVPMKGLENCARIVARLAAECPMSRVYSRLDDPAAPAWLSVWSASPREENHFFAGATSDGVLISQDWLAAEIYRKNLNIASYRKNCDRVVLLIVSSFALQSTVYAPDNIETWHFAFDFDEVLVLFQDPGRVHRLKRQRRVSAA